MSRRKTEWYRTGEARIVPSWFGFLRAEFFERRDFIDPDSGEIMEYQLRTRSAGRLPAEYDGPGAFGFWSTLATPNDAKYGYRAIYNKFVKMFNKPEGWKIQSDADR